MALDALFAPLTSRNRALRGVAVGRALLVDPQWAQKVRDGSYAHLALRQEQGRTGLLRLPA